jgi:hypothetical protein
MVFNTRPGTRNRLPLHRSRWPGADPAGVRHGRRPGPGRRDGPTGPVRQWVGVQVLHPYTGLAPACLGDREHRPQGPTDEQGRFLPAADHPDPGRRRRPQAGPATGQDLLHADGRTRRRSPQGAVRGRRGIGRTRLGRDETGRCRTSSAISTAHRSPRSRRNGSSRRTSPSRTRSAAGAAAARHRAGDRLSRSSAAMGEGPSTSRTRRHDKSHEHLTRSVDKRGDLPRPRSCAGTNHTVNPKERARAARTPRAGPWPAR